MSRSGLSCLVCLLSITFAPLSARAAPPTVAFTSPTTIAEGMEVTVQVAVTDPDGDLVTWSWDTNNDGVFGELPDAASFTVPATDTDGPAMLRIGVQASDGTETRTVVRTIEVTNVAPTITSHPLTDAAIRREYRYEVSADDPAGARDPLRLVLGTAPAGMMVDGSALTWTPTVAQRGATFTVVLQANDGDGGVDEQSWMIMVSRNTAPVPPTLVSPIDRARVSADEPVTLVIQNGTDEDGDELVYFFRLARNTQFDGMVTGSGEISAEPGETTSWTTRGPLAPGLWYWQVMASDGIVDTPLLYASFVVGTGELADAGADASIQLDASYLPGVEAPRGCSVSAAGSSASSGWLAALVVALGTLLVRRRGSRRDRR